MRESSLVLRHMASLFALVLPLAVLGPLSFVLVLCALYFLVLSLRQPQDTDHLPGPSKTIASWIWGHEYLAFTHEATRMYTIWAKSFGPFYKIKGALFHDDIIIATDPKAVHHIFADVDTYVKSPAFRPPIANLLGEGIVWAESNDHRLQRKFFSPAFSQESIKGMSSDIHECAERLASNIINDVISGSTTINIVDYTSTATLDIIGRVAFGHDFKATSASIATDAQEIREAWHHHVIAGLLMSSFVAPIVIRALPGITNLPFPLMRAQGACKLIVKRLSGLILERERLTGIDGREGHDILTLMLRARREDQSVGLTDDQIMDNISTFIMVGHETTAGSINATLLELARHPSIQSRLREEIVSKGQDISYEDLHALPLLDAVLKESLRLHPNSPQTERMATRDDVIPLSAPLPSQPAEGKLLDSVQVKKGQVILIPFTSMNVDERTWGPDATHFDPDRWIVPGGVPKPSELPSGWSGLLTFCDGPRNCIGWRLAIFEMKVILATLIRSIEFHDTKCIVQERISPTLQPLVDGKAGVLPLGITLVR